MCRFITSELAGWLGVSASGLHKQPLGDLLPQPWSHLHNAQWLTESRMMSAPSHDQNGSGSQQKGGGVDGGIGGLQPQAQRTRCLAGATMVVGASSKVQGYYKVGVKPVEDKGVPLQVRAHGGMAGGGRERLCGLAALQTGQRCGGPREYRRTARTLPLLAMQVVTVEKSNLQTALNERRLSVVVDAATGKVLEVRQQASSEEPRAGFILACLRGPCARMPPNGDCS